MAEAPNQDGFVIPGFLRRCNAVQCMRCRVEVPADKIDVKDRCVDKDCPLRPENRNGVNHAND